MRDELKARFWNVLLEPRTLQRGYFKPGAVKALISEHLQGRRNRSGLLWRMLVLEMWHRNFLESKSSWGAARSIPSLEAREVRKYPAGQGAPLSGGFALKGIIHF
jgi:hypothetical protein